jgi:hypothetical protein
MSRLMIAAMLAAALSAAGCGNDSTTPTSPTPPETFTDTFTGTLNRNGASTHQFSVAAAGAVYATLTSVSDTSIAVGFSLGAWNGSACTAIISNDQAVQGSAVTGQATNVGTLCARIYDVGRISSPVDYQITVVHY